MGWWAKWNRTISCSKTSIFSILSGLWRILSQFEDTLVDDETVVNEIIYSKDLHHATDASGIPPYVDLEGNGVHKVINNSLQNFFLPPFSFKQGDVINDAPSQEIIVETLCHERMVMSSSQPMNPLVCHIQPYWLLVENDEHIERRFLWHF